MQLLKCVFRWGVGMNPEHGGELALCVTRDHSFKATQLKASSLVLRYPCQSCVGE